MQKIFEEVGSLDKRCYELYRLSEDVLMEHAANSMAKFCEKNFTENSVVLIICGPGNNGADGIAMARLLHTRFDVKLYIPFGVKSQMANFQRQRADAIGVQVIDYLCTCDILVDCLFGSGLNKELNKQSNELIKKMNFLDAYKISCDVPSGINNLGQVKSVAFYADTTITMGALKQSLYSDIAKNYVGKIEVTNLGIQRSLYEDDTYMYLLEEKDMKLPFRRSQNTHKGSFGHACIIVGEKKGAGKIACDAAFKFGSGLVSAMSHENLELDYHIMSTHCIPNNTTAIAIGMGLGNHETKEIENILSLNIPKVIDADLFYEETILKVLGQDVVLTPHPKEFCSLLKLCNIADIDIETLQDNRLEYVKKFIKKYPIPTLLLKGANTIIASNKTIYFNTLGNASLSKGGSGDVLCGLIVSLLAQRYKSSDAAITASLAHALAAKNFEKNSYSLTPHDIIEGVCIL